MPRYRGGQVRSIDDVPGGIVVRLSTGDWDHEPMHIYDAGGIARFRQMVKENRWLLVDVKPSEVGLLVVRFALASRLIRKAAPPVTWHAAM